MASTLQGGLEITVNGRPHQVQATPETPLLYVLRNELNLNAAKFGCGLGQCGACTVHLNGAPVRSCSLPAMAAARGEVTTVEGLSPDGTHPVQLAWREIDVPQCGYCQAGQIMSAVALLKEHPKPTDAEIDQAMNGNLCRCATYPRIRAAIHRAAELS